ncbi:hypothetical protein BJ912DRAFT_1041732 [Pholiota molesta]|nr:hypothetical protein BJ912DRAFT_1041732 [Pholiota molesta]
MRKADPGPKGRNILEEKEEAAGGLEARVGLRQMQERRTRGQDGLMPQAARVTALLLPRSLDLVVEITLGRKAEDAFASSGDGFSASSCRWALEVDGYGLVTFVLEEETEVPALLVVTPSVVRHLIHLSPPSRRPPTASPTIRFVVDHWSSSLPNVSTCVQVSGLLLIDCIRLNSTRDAADAVSVGLACGGVANAVGEEEPSNSDRDIDQQVSELLYLLRRTEVG